MKIGWTKSQQEAIAKRNSDMLVSASAGSGKTTVMIERMASMIAAGSANVDNILALTFTKASAADMRAKLRKRLEREVSSEIQSQLELLGMAAIQTFHQFCTNLVRTHFSLVGADPAFSVLDDVDAAAIKSEVLDTVIATNYARCMDAVDAFTASRQTRGLKDVIMTVVDFLESRTDGEEWLGEVALAAYEPDMDKNIATVKMLEHWRAVGAHFVGKFGELCIAIESEDARNKNLLVAQACLDVAKRLAAVKRYEELGEIGLVKLPALDWRNAVMMYDELKATKTKFSGDDVLGRLKKYPPIGDVIKNQAHDRVVVEQLVHLVREFRRAFVEHKSQEGRLDFSDLEKFATMVLQDVGVAGVLRERFKWVFVDEYQDTNPVQESILAKLAGEQNMFMVGDVKQSIYGFRGCDSSIFSGKMDDFQNKVGKSVVCLSENFRSDSAVLDFVDTVFGALMDGYAPFGAKEKSKGGSVGITLVDTIYAQSMVVAEQVAKHVTGGKFGFGDIAVLARSKTHLGELCDVLNAHGIPCVVEMKQKARELPEIAVLDSMLFAVANPTNEAALVVCMQELFAFSPNDLARIRLNSKQSFWECLNLCKDDKSVAFVAFVNKYHAMTRRMSVAEILRAFVVEHGYLDKCGVRQATNVQNFLVRIADLAAGATVARYLYLVEHGMLDVELAIGGGGDAVRVMTMHNSKGLEFPVVIVFDAGAKFSTQDSRKQLVVDRELGLCIYSADTDEYVKTNTVARLGAQINAKRVQVAEEMRLWYVALTRAKVHLYIVGSGRVRDFEWFSCNSFLDFMQPVAHMADVREQCRGDYQSPVDTLTPAEPLIDKELAAEFRKQFDWTYGDARGVDVVLKHSVTSLTAVEKEVLDRPVRQLQRGEDRGESYGTLFHAAMQAEWQSQIVGDRVGRLERDIKKCVEVVGEFTKGMRLFPEMAFLQTMELDGAEVVVQGVVDLLAVGEDGRKVLIDYKTTRATETELVALYSGQLGMYTKAVGCAESYIYSTHLGKMIRV